MKRSGLTLLELIVVLVILVAVAGIAVPLLPGMIGRAHTAEHSTNISEINKIVETFNLLNRAYPDNLDQLTAWAVLPGDGTATGTCGGNLASVTLTASDVAALSNAGITKVYTLSTAADRDLVSAPYTSTTPTALAAGAVAGLSDAAKLRLYNDASTGATGSKYAVFGLGNGCELIGKTGGMPEAPLHFSDEKGTGGDPTRTYARFGLVFRVADTTGVSLETAQFVGTVALHEDDVTNSNDAAAEYHRSSRQ